MPPSNPLLTAASKSLYNGTLGHAISQAISGLVIWRLVLEPVTASLVAGVRYPLVMRSGWLRMARIISSADMSLWSTVNCASGLCESLNSLSLKFGLSDLSSNIVNTPLYFNPTLFYTVFDSQYLYLVLSA